MKNKIKITLLLTLLTLLIPFSKTFAQENPPTAKVVNSNEYDVGEYKLINKIGNIEKVADQSPNGFSDFVNLLIKIAIAMAGALAVVIIIVHGVQYMGTDSVWGKSESKLKMGSAIGGLVLLLSSYLILYTINPDLVNIKIGISKVNEGEWEEYTEQNNYDNTPISSSAECKNGLIEIPNVLKTKPGVDNNICKDLADKLILLKTKTSGLDFVITATTDGSHASSCHKKGNNKTGSCVDIALRKNSLPVPADDLSWGILCEAVHSIPGIDFLNEASKTPKCEAIHPNKQTKYRTGTHLHIIYTEK